jgi:hypothetical protein
LPTGRWSALLLAVGLVASSLSLVTVVHASSAGALPLSSSCPAVGAAATADGFHPIAPVRVLDSRLASSAWGGTRLGLTPRTLTVAGVFGIPADATAISAEVVVTGGTAVSALSVWKTGDPMPTTPVFGFEAGQTFEQSAGVAIGADHTITFANAAGSTDVILDVKGYYGAGGAVCRDVAPTEVLHATLGPNETRSLTAPSDVPVTATALVVRLDALASTASTFISALPGGGSQLSADLIVPAGGQPMPSNVTTVVLGPGATIDVKNASGSVVLAVSVVGYFDPTATAAPGRSLAVTTSPGYGTTPLLVSASATAVGGAFDSVTWDWGDGSAPTTGTAVTHSYVLGGARRIRATATDGAATYVVDAFIALSATAPGAPSAVVATALRGAANVAWQAAPDGGRPVTYTVTSAPGDETCTTAALTCAVPGLTPGVAYTFTVVATNSIGAGPPSLPSAAVVPFSGWGYHALDAPQRVFDSRAIFGGWGSPLPAGSTRDILLSTGGSSATVPSYAGAIVANVTVTGGTLPSYLTAWSWHGPKPTSSTLNYGAGQTIANLVTVTSFNGPILSVATAAGQVDVIVDVVGYYDGEGFDPSSGSGASHSLYHPTTPTRALDSRTSVGGWNGPLTAAAPRTLAVRAPNGPAAVPSTATAVIANVTATNATAGSFLSAWPTGISKPSTSTVNFGPGETASNQTILKVGTDGTVTFANAVGATDVVVDIVGYFDPTAGNWFHPIGDADHHTSAIRFLDDRVGVSVTGPWGPGQTRTVAVAGGTTPGSSIPIGATAVVANLTATNGTAGSYLSAFAAGAPRPVPSVLNVAAGQTRANTATVQLGTGGSISLYNNAGTVDLIGDASGYFAPY